MTASSQKHLRSDRVIPQQLHASESVLGSKHGVRKTEENEDISEVKLEIPEGSDERKKSEYLKIDVQVTIAQPKKKKGSFKQKTITLCGDGLVIGIGKKAQIFPLHSFCLLQKEEEYHNSMKLSPRGSPFGKRNLKLTKDSDKTMLLCTHDLTRIWLRFSDSTEFTEWFLSIDGLLGVFYSSSLLKPSHKSSVLADRYMKNIKGGSIKVGDAEEWTYVGKSGRLICSLTNTPELQDFVFEFDGQFFRPLVDTFSIGGEWDGMNILWYENISNPNEYKRKQNAKKCYNWNQTKQEFYLMCNDFFAMEDTWKLTRNFLARTEGVGNGWLQIEGDTPVCLAMFLHLFYESLPSLTLE